MGSFLRHFYFSPVGRTGRKLYWICGIVPLIGGGMVIGFLAAWFRMPRQELLTLLTVVAVVGLWTWISIGARRLHDIGFSGGWMAALIILPVVLYFFIPERSAQLPLAVEMLLLGLLPGKGGDNRFGREPDSFGTDTPESAELAPSSPPSRSRWAIASVAALLLFAVGMYAINPLGAMTSSPIARITGIDTLRQPSVAMEPTILMGDRVFSSTWTFRSREPAVGDVVVFRYPADPSMAYAKRIVAGPGDMIELRHCRVVLNDTHPSEPYLDLGSGVDDPVCQFGPETVPAGMYALFNDNRLVPIDSRMWGFVPRTAIVGKVLGY